MKKYLFVVCGLFLLISCSKEDETIYSCDKTIDTWVKSNIDDIQSMNREKWVHLDETYKRASYRAFTPTQKIKFWREKFKEVKQLNWSEKELNHIMEAEQFLNKHLDIMEGELTDEQLDELELFFYQWSCYGEEHLGWSKETAIAIAGSGNRMLDKKGSPESYNKKAFTRGHLECDCNDSWWKDFCPPGYPCDSEGRPCDRQSDGCGWFWVQECNGVCEGLP